MDVAMYQISSYQKKKDTLLLLQLLCLKERHCNLLTYKLIKYLHYVKRIILLVSLFITNLDIITLIFFN